MPDSGTAGRVERLFHEALAMAPDERAAFLDRECGGDGALRDRVRALLAAAERVAGEPGWDEPGLAHEARAAAEGSDELDRYRLLERIGAGGMGVVYRATRADDYSQQVAIKIVHAAGGDEALAARFRTERQILAGLAHPNIARLLDGGTTRSGLPFLVMELVDGAPLDRYMAERRPPLRATLQLFRKICAAVSCAHRNLVVHRDLKPGNILVTRDGEPKLLDFGVAKLLDESGDRTRTGAGAMTPEYASPEQIRGGAITVASDIYALGVILYELLSGQSPYRATTGALELAKAITEDEPVRLLDVDEDLARIAGMALRKDPARRYASVDQFAEDVRRWLEGYPVSARADSRWYRSRKFLGRHRASVAAAGLVLAALAGGILSTARQARVAERRFQDLRKLADAYLFEFHDAIRNLPGSTAARQLVVKRALEYLDRLSAEKGSDRALTRDLASAYQKVAEVQGLPNSPNLGDAPGAMANARKALALREGLGARAAEDAGLALEIAGNHALIGRLLTAAGDLRAAESSQRKALALAEGAVSRGGGAAARNAVAQYSAALADVLGNPNVPNLGDTRAAIELYRKALAIQDELAAANPADRERRREAIARRYQIGQMEQALNDGPAAVAAFGECLARLEELAREEPENATTRSGLAKTHRALAMAYVQLMQKAEEARPHSERAVELFAALEKSDPANVDGRIALGDAYYAHGYVLRNAKAPREALGYYDRAIEVYEAAMRERPGRDLAMARTAYQLRADALLDLGECARAMESSRKVWDIDRKLLAIDPENAGAARNMGIAFAQLGRANEMLGRWREAAAWHGREVEILEAQQKKGTLIPQYAKRLEAARAAVARCKAR